MRLILLDHDLVYQEQFRIVVSSQSQSRLEVFTSSSLHEFMKLAKDYGPECFLIIHEDFIESILLNQEVLKFCQQYAIVFLTEGIIDPIILESSSKLISHLCLIRDHWLHKYQAIEHLLNELKECYLSQCNYMLNLQHKATTILSLYKPFSDFHFSKNLETTLKQLPINGNILIIHYDPYYDSKIKTKFNLSYLFTSIKRKKTNLSLILDEIKMPIAKNIDVLSGPLNMLDIDCLSDVEYKTYLDWLCHELSYDFVILNFNGLHITKHVQGILENSKECILYEQNEDVVLSIRRQTKLIWTMILDEDKNVLKEVLKANEGRIKRHTSI